MKDRHCVVCNGEEFEAKMHLTDHSITKEKFDLYNCLKCGFVFTENAPSEVNAGQYYKSEEYISHSDTNKGIVAKLYHFVRKIMLGRKYRLINSLTDDKCILDVGCGTGYFLDYMKQKEYQTLGVEVDEDAREYGKNKFQLEILPPKELSSIKEKFGVITLWHVLEHLYSPNEYLNTLKSLLKDENAYLVIALPNYQSFDGAHYKTFWAGYDVPRHLWHFSPKTLEMLAQKNGLEVVKMKRLPFDSFYNSMLSEKYKGSKFSVLKGGMIGGVALLQSLFNIRKSSSIIYVLKKQK